MKAILRAGWRSRALLCAAALVAVALGVVAPAQAAPVTIAGPGTASGKVERPVGVAVDNDPASPGHGNLYVADGQNFRIDKFDSTGKFRLAWGWGVADATPAAETCGPEASPPTIRCFEWIDNTIGPGVATAAGAVHPTSVAVEPGTGDVYVAESATKRVSKFTADGEFLFMVGKGVNASGITQEEKNICTAEDVAQKDKCGTGASASGAGEYFSSPSSLAVDAAKHLWVGDSSRLIELDSAGKYLSEAPVPGGGGVVKGLGIDPVSGDFYLKSESLSGIRRYAISGSPPIQTLTPVGSPIDAAGKPEALALDAAGNLYVGEATSPYRFLRFDPVGNLASLFGEGQAIGLPQGNALAVGESLYSASSVCCAGSAVQRFDLPQPGPLPEGLGADVLPTTATLKATLNPEGRKTTYRFQYLTRQAYEEQGNSFEGPRTESTPEATLPGSEYGTEEVSAAIAGLVPETEYRFRLVASNSEGEVKPEAAFTTRPAVAIEAQWAASVDARGATLAAELDPLGGEGTRWWVEYGTSPCEGGSCARSAEASLPASFGEIPVSVPLGGLAPATAYHYRFAAKDVRGGKAYEVHGPDRSFTTGPADLGFALPDSRAWEMVSPPNKFGGAIVLGVKGEGHLQAAADGNAVAYLSAGSIEAVPQGSRAPERSTVLSRRTPGGRWSSEDLTTPNATVSPLVIGVGFEYRLFAPDLGAALVEPRGRTLLSAAASEQTPYVRENAEPPSFAPLVSGCPVPPAPCPAAIEAQADVPAGRAFGTPPGEDPLTSNRWSVAISGATSGLAHVVLDSEAPLAEGVAGRGLYEWTAGAPAAQRLAPLSALPGGGAVVAAELGSGAASLRGAISADGSRVFWSTYVGEHASNHPTALYLRYNATEPQSALGGGGECTEPAKACTIRLDAPLTGAFGTGKAEPAFQGANPSGTVAFFTDTQNLTPDANEDGADLYRCRIVAQAGGLGCELTDLSAHTANPEDLFESPEVQGIAAGVSEDGSRVYFVARGVLAGEGSERATPGQPNLYLWQEGRGTRFIATLAGEDSRDWGLQPSSPTIGPEASEQSAAASPSGRYLAFMSQLPLTGYDNRDARSGEADEEVFRYDAEAGGGKGALICASCNPSGARPAGRRGFGGSSAAPFYDPHELWRGRAVAAVLPEATKLGVGGPSLYRPRAVQDDGRLFFNAADSLVPADSNGTWDVYEYEPTGLGSCGASAGAATAPTAAGCVSLISSGAGTEEAGFLDASEGGSDAFFFTSAQLSVTDEDQVYDVYDARVNGEAATLDPRAECQGEACQPPAIPPAVQPPASAAFRGPGNLRETSQGRRCPKGRRKVRRNGAVRCVKAKRSHPKRHRGRNRQAHRHNRRASR